MKFYSTNDTSLRVNLKEAVLNSLPKDRGLYMPEQIGRLPERFWSEFGMKGIADIACDVTEVLLDGDFEREEIWDFVSRAINFDAPLHSLTSNIHVLELFHGPTLAFKDFGARFMAQLMRKLTRGDKEPLTILVATSGDTGGAVASGFLKVEDIQVFILYPSGRVSPLQEKQLTTLGNNIVAFEVEGAFDDCQALVKQAFLDEELTDKFRLTSANSINIARLIPQSFYYFRAYQQLKKNTSRAVFCVPSGNFGNLTAGLMARKLGLPFKKMLAATNANDVVPQYLKTGNFVPRDSQATLSNAMDVGNPSNFVRMQDLFGGSWDEMKGFVEGYAYDDSETLGAIAEVREKYDYVLDPHTAVGYLAAVEYLESHPDDQVIVLGTAHPSKFPEAVKEATGEEPNIPVRLAKLASKEKESIGIKADFEEFKKALLEFGKA